MMRPNYDHGILPPVIKWFLTHLDCGAVCVRVTIQIRELIVSISTEKGIEVLEKDVVPERGYVRT